jgi:hypothetical protein
MFPGSQKGTPQRPTRDRLLPSSCSSTSTAAGLCLPRLVTSNRERLTAPPDRHAPPAFFGEKPAHLWMIRLTKFDLAIFLKTIGGRVCVTRESNALFYVGAFSNATAKIRGSNKAKRCAAPLQQAS